MSKDDSLSVGLLSSVRLLNLHCCKDKNLDGLVTQDMKNLSTSNFRDWLIEIRPTENRMHRRRNGNVEFTKEGHSSGDHLL